MLLTIRPCILQQCCPFLNKASSRTITIKPRSVLSPGTKRRSGPPYNHFVQIGDPVLRAQCDPVNPADINTEYVQSVIAAMKFTLGRFDGVGVSAPQVGVPLQIMMVQFTPSQLSTWSEEEQKKRKMEVIPLKIFINPKMKIIDSKQVFESRLIMILSQPNCFDHSVYYTA